MVEVGTLKHLPQGRFILESYIHLPELISETEQNPSNRILLKNLNWELIYP